MDEWVCILMDSRVVHAWTIANDKDARRRTSSSSVAVSLIVTGFLVVRDVEDTHRGLGHQHLHHPLLLHQSPLLQHHVQRVQKRVERRVERQHEDGHPNVDLARDRESLSRQQAQQTDGEPAQEVRHGDGDQPTRDAQILGLPGAAVCGDAVGSDGGVDGGLPGGDEEEENEVEDDDDAEGVAAAFKVVPGDGQRDADAGLAVELPVGRGGQQGDRSQNKPDDPQTKGSYFSRTFLEVQAM